MRKKNIFLGVFVFLIFIGFSVRNLTAQENRKFALTAEKLQTETTVDLNKLAWKYHAGDQEAWAAADFNDADWETVNETRIDLDTPPAGGWNGRAWFRLKFDLGEQLAGKNLALIPSQTGASEIYLDGEKLVSFGEIGETGDVEYDPNHLPVIFHLDRAGEHTLAVRYSSSISANQSGLFTRWLKGSGFRPGFVFAVRSAADLNETVKKYAGDVSMRIGFLFAGFLFALALLHFLFYGFYRAERANLFYGIFVTAFAVNLIIGNYRTFGHLGVTPSLILSILSLCLLGIIFTMLPAFLLVAFARPLNKIFWALTFGWVAGLGLYFVFLNRFTIFRILPYVMISFSFIYCIILLIKSLREKRSGAWILLGGVIALQFGMLFILLIQLGVSALPEDFYFIAELGLMLGVPVAVSIFLARNFARTNRDLKTQLEQVETLSHEKIEQERRTAELRAENERRAKELEEARQLQLSMLPKNLPELPNLEIAAYMKPATEVGGDYYDFHVGKDGTLTVAVGDATGHGLKAGTVVTATKGLFNNLAPAPDIPDTLQQISRSLKAMNLRGLFMAMTLLKIKNNRLSISAAGMPSTLIYRHATGEIEKIDLRALPLGGIAGIKYQKQEFQLAPNDLIVLMSDGFPEMFNDRGEMLGDEEADKILLESANLAPQEIIECLIKRADSWADGRPPDDDVTFVVLKAKNADGNEQSKG